MLSEKQKRIIRLLLTSKEGYNVNQVARILNISVSWCHETLRLLENQGVLASVKIANSILFRINWENPKAEKICDFVILDEESRDKPKNLNFSTEKEELQNVSKQNSINHNPTYSVSDTNLNNKNTDVYSFSRNSGLGDVESPYRQAIANQNINNFGYSVAPIGDRGVNNVLFAYATSGSFGNFNAYSSSGYTNNSPVPPGTLGSIISNNVSGFTLTMHTTSHKANVEPGCRYCGPEVKGPF